MSKQTETPASDVGSAPLVPETTGSLSLRPEILEGFLSVRQQVDQLQSLMHQVMRRVALPRTKEIGAELIRLRSFYKKGKTGPGGVSSDFYRDAEATTGLKKRSLQGYISIAENWPRLMDYMADLPEGATPVTSLRGALEAIREMNRPLQPALSEGAVDVDARAVEGGEEQAAAEQRTHYAARSRKVIADEFTALKAVSVLTDGHRERLDKIQEALRMLLDDIDRLEGEAAEAEPARKADENWEVREAIIEGEDRTITYLQKVSEPPKPREIQVTVWPSEPREKFIEVPRVSGILREGLETTEQASRPEAAGAKAGKKGVLAGTYPKTKAGWEALEADLAAHGSGEKLGKHLGVSKQAVSSYRKSMKKALGME